VFHEYAEHVTVSYTKSRRS